MFRVATKEQTRLRMAIYGPSGAGKSFSALRIASGLGGRVAVIDTEHRSAAKYADRFAFDVAELTGDRGIEMVINGLAAAAKAGYEVLIIDSLSHAWQGLLEEIDKLAATKYRGSTWQAWAEGTPKQRRMVEALLSYPGHLIATMRSKTEWVVSNEGGRAKPVRVGLAPEQGKGIEYEFDLLLEITADHVAHVVKDRTGQFQGRLIERPDEAFGRELAGWFAAAPPDSPPVSLPNGQVDTPAGPSLSSRAGPSPVSHAPCGLRAGQSLSPERVEGLRCELNKLGVGDHCALAAQVLSRPVASLAELTEAEARRVWNEARRSHRPPPPPASDEAAAAVLD